MGLRQVFADDLEVVDRATVETIGAALARAAFDQRPFHFLHILAHGQHDEAGGLVCLHGNTGGLDAVDAECLARSVRGHGVQLVFLCSCQSAMTGGHHFAGTGQQLLHHLGGDVAAVIATQANLPVAGSAELVSRFFAMLGSDQEPAAALARARVEAYRTAISPAWSVPVLLTRPTPRQEARSTGTASDLPQRKATFQDRPEQIGAVLRALHKGRLVTVLGLPGIGKTEVAREAARRCQSEGRFRRIIYRQVDRSWDVEILRARLAAASGDPTAAEDPLRLAALLGSRPTLLVLDNAEDLMLEDGPQRAFCSLLDTLLDHAPSLHVLLASRWQAGTVTTEHQVHVPPMPRTMMDQLLRDELDAAGRLDPAWPGSDPWQRLLDLVDGHPRSLWLISRQVAGSRLGLEPVVQRLEQLREEAVVDPSLVGRADVLDAMPDQSQRRLLSLVASIDLSFEVLLERHPDAAELFVGLSFFPAGLPDRVALAVAGGAGQAIDPLFHYHLLESERGRCFFPAPLGWYANRERERRKVLDPSRWFAPALEAFVPHLEACDARITEGELVAGVDAVLEDEATLRVLAEWAASSGADKASTLLAGAATAAANAMLFADRHDELRRLLDVGLAANPATPETKSQLASCHLHRGRLQMREDDLDGARKSYSAALPIFREIRARLGEANCLQSFALLDLAEDRPSSAFSHFVEVLQIFESIRDGLGIQSALGYLARTAAACGADDQAMALSEASLSIGRQINDRFGQTITLGLQVSVLAQQDESEAAIGAMLIFVSLAKAIGQPQLAEQYAPFLADVQGQLGPEQWQQLVEGAEELRAAAVARAKARLKEAGFDMFQIPPGNDEG